MHCALTNVAEIIDGHATHIHLHIVWVGNPGTEHLRPAQHSSACSTACMQHISRHWTHTLGHVQIFPPRMKEGMKHETAMWGHLKPRQQHDGIRVSAPRWHCTCRWEALWCLVYLVHHCLNSCTPSPSNLLASAHRVIQLELLAQAVSLLQ